MVSYHLVPFRKMGESIYSYYWESNKAREFNQSLCLICSAFMKPGQYYSVINQNKARWRIWKWEEQILYQYPFLQTQAFKWIQESKLKSSPVPISGGLLSGIMIYLQLSCTGLLTLTRTKFFVVMKLWRLCEVQQKEFLSLSFSQLWNFSHPHRWFKIHCGLDLARMRLMREQTSFQSC